MDMMTASTTEKARRMLEEMGHRGPLQRERIDRLAAVLAEHPDAQLQQCADENTGRRYGRAACRVGRCAKIGSTTYKYQLWAVWGGAR